MINQYEIKDLIQQLTDMIAKIGTMLKIDNRLEDAFRYELAQFMMYLSASDGEIKWSEASIIAKLCDLDVTPQTMSTIIKKNNIFSTEFEQKVPVSLKVAVGADNLLLEKYSSEDVSDLPTIMISLYKEAAKLLMNADGDEDQNERRDCQIYIDMMENYVNANATRRKMSVTGFVKNTVSASPMKISGVPAPKKKG